MSDGPHRSLNMRRDWRRLAERADAASFEPEEVLDTLPAALEHDWRAEVPERLCHRIRGILDDPQGSFFEDQVTRLDSLKAETAGLPLSDILLDCTMMAVINGYSGDPALREAARLALHCRAASGARQVEEHYFRKSTTHRAAHVRARIENAISRSDFVAIAGRAMGSDSGPPQVLVKKTGLDDGVRLSSGRNAHD